MITLTDASLSLGRGVPPRDVMDELNDVNLIFCPIRKTGIKKPGTCLFPVGKFVMFRCLPCAELIPHAEFDFVGAQFVHSNGCCTV